MGIKIRRSSEAAWRGTVDAGVGHIALGSGAFSGPYSLRARIADEPQTNPEELIAAAHAGCFAMALSSLLSDAGHPPTEVAATATVQLEETETGFSITRIALAVKGDVPTIEEADFVRLAEEAKRTCPVSRALAGTEITLEASLEATAAGAA